MDAEDGSMQFQVRARTYRLGWRPLPPSAAAFTVGLNKLATLKKRGEDVIVVDVIVLPDRTPRKGRIDPSATLESAKKGILQKANPEANPADYDIAVIPRHRNPPLSTIGIAANDLIIISPRDELGPELFQFVR